MTPLAEHLDLYDPERATLELDPEGADAVLYVDVHGILPSVRSILSTSPNAPKLLVTGEWGMGKSHTLRHVAERLLPDLGISYLPVHVKLGGLVPKAAFLDVYGQIILALRGHLDAALRALSSIPASMLLGVSQDGELALRTLHQRLQTGAAEEALGAIRMWLSGSGPTPAQTMKLGLGTRLRDSSNHVDLVPLLRAASRLIHEATRRRVVVFLDEGTAFTTPRGVDTMLSISEGLRELFDPSNSDLGVVLGLYNRTGRSPGLRFDVLDRLSNRRVDLQPLRRVEDVQKFVGDLSAGLSRRHLFTPDAMVWFARQALVAAAPANVPGSVSPRGLLKLLDDVVQEALRRNVRPPLPLNRVQAWLPERAV